MRIRVPWYRRRKTVTAVIACLGLLLAYLDHHQSSGRRGDDRERYDGQVFRCVGVLDGDTVDIDVPDQQFARTRVRLLGIDTPEVGRDGRPSMHFATEAAAYTTTHLLNQDVRIELDSTRTRDRFGRLLAYVAPPTDHTSFNALLIATGHAYAHRRFEHARRQRFIELEGQARSESKGLWKDLTLSDMPGWRRQLEQSVRRSGSSVAGSG